VSLNRLICSQPNDLAASAGQISDGKDPHRAARTNQILT
jgi:hypothetical protein